MTRLIANMVVRNEADRYLEDVLLEIVRYADYLVITDDCSTDDTFEICKEYADVVYSTPEPLFCTNEGALRQMAWENLEQHAEKGDWVLAIDADEIIWETKWTMRELIESPKYDVVGLQFINMWNETQYRVDKFWKPTLCTKLFRYMEGGSIKDRKLACGSEPTYVEKCVKMGRWKPESGLKIQHLGYMRDDDKIAKYERYQEIDGGKYHNGAHLKSIIDKNPELVDWDFKRV